MRTVTFQGEGMEPRTHHPRRIGRPKEKFASTELDRIWGKIQTDNGYGDDYDDENHLHWDMVITRARQVLKHKGKVVLP